MYFSLYFTLNARQHKLKNYSLNLQYYHPFRKLPKSHEKVAATNRQCATTLNDTILKIHNCLTNETLN